MKMARALVVLLIFLNSADSAAYMLGGSGLMRPSFCAMPTMLRAKFVATHHVHQQVRWITTQECQLLKRQHQLEYNIVLNAAAIDQYVATLNKKAIAHYAAKLASDQQKLAKIERDLFYLRRAPLLKAQRAIKNDSKNNS